MPAARKTSLSLRDCRSDDLRSAPRRAACSIRCVAEVDQQLSVLLRHHVVVRLGEQPGRGVEHCGKLLGNVVDARRIAAHVEDGVGRPAQQGDLARLLELRRELNHHPVHLREPAQPHSLVLHSVGAAHHASLRVPLEQLGMDRRGVLRLRGDDHDIVGGRSQAVDRRDRLDLDDFAALRGAQRQPPLIDGCGVCSPCDQGNVGAGLSQPASDRAPDCTSSVDDHTHCSALLPAEVGTHLPFAGVAWTC